jgi:hypothetical protein
VTWLPLLLADPSPCLRWLVLRQLFNQPADHPEVQELETLRPADPLVSELLALQQPDGAWARGTLGPGRKGSHVHTTALGLLRLGYLGFDSRFPAVQRAAAYLFDHQQPDGSWPLTAVVDEASSRSRKASAGARHDSPADRLSPACAGLLQLRHRPARSSKHDWLLAPAFGRWRLAHRQSARA